MNFLLQMRERFLKYYETHDTLVRFLFRFAMLLISLSVVTYMIGFASILCMPLVIVAISVAGAFGKNYVQILIVSSVITIHLYAISSELETVVLCIFAISYLVVFRFAPRAVNAVLLTFMCFALQIPYVLPIVIALYVPVSCLFSVNMGILMYYILRNVSKFELNLTRDIMENSSNALLFVANHILNNKEMLIMMVSFTIIIVVVGIIRNSSLNNAWRLATVVGTIVQLFLIVILYFIWRVDTPIIMFIIETAIALFIGLMSSIFTFNASYAKTERLEFEDDDYYYYVKAVPKIKVSVDNIKVTHINAKNSKEKDKKKEQ